MDGGYEQMADDRAGEEFLLALLNTTPTLDGERLDAIGGDAEARAWLAANSDAGPDSVDLAALRHARTALQRLVHGDDAAVADLEPLLEDVGLRPRIAADGLDWDLTVPPGQEPAVRAILAWDALRKRSPGRLKECANEECSLFLIDRSKNKGARWCSMAGCGNRLKARRHYERQSRSAR
jgi:predicted RNA-binding Zn ribbon-like protein